MIIVNAYIISGIITTDWEGDNDTPKRLNGRNKGVISKNYAPFYWVYM